MSLSASLRAPEGYHLPNAMEASQLDYPGLFNKFGGHPCAAGFSIEAENLSKAKELMQINLGKQGQELLDSQQTTTQIRTDVQSLPPSLAQYHNKKEIIWLEELKVTNMLLEDIDSLDPYGQDFPLPLLAFPISLGTTNTIQWLGTEKKHLKLKTLNAIPLTFFNIKPETRAFFESNPKTQTGYVMAKLSQNCWNNKRVLELIVEKFFLI